MELRRLSEWLGTVDGLPNPAFGLVATAGLTAVNHASLEEEHQRLDCSASPHHSGKAWKVWDAPSDRLAGIRDPLHRRPLLVAGRFDDDQAQRHARFDSDGNRICASPLMRSNGYIRTLSRSRGQR